MMQIINDKLIIMMIINYCCPIIVAKKIAIENSAAKVSLEGMSSSRPSIRPC